MKLVHAPHLGRSVLVGGRRRPNPMPGERRLALTDYLDPACLPSPPSSVDYTAKASSALSKVYCNDRLGCCVIAGYYHVLGVATGNASGTPFVATDDQIITDYEAIGGYNPADPTTDQGCDEWSALQHWHDNAAADGSKLAAFVALDPTNATELQIALWLFGNHYYGLELPDAWLAPIPSPGGTWDVAGLPNDQHGHCIIGAGYDGAGVTVATWGMLLKLTWRAIAKYAVADAGGDLFVILTPDWIAKGQQLAPSGVDWASLQADLNALAVPSPILPPDAPPTQPGA